MSKAVGTRVVWDDDGVLNHGAVEKAIPSPGRPQATHCGNLYVVKFDDGYTRNFDDYDFTPEGRLILEEDHGLYEKMRKRLAYVERSL